MQFPVPQFTDVEDKIIGPLTIKQFGILFGGGVLVFLGYSTTKSIIVLVIMCLLIGIPVLGLAFAKINGRPLYNTISYFTKFMLSPKVMVFHKEAVNLGSKSNLKDAQMASTQAKPAPTQPAETADERLKKVEELLRATSVQEKDVAGKLR
ncbi:MAG: PrgI family protein [Candidatus Doudnabacteria bacterium]|nr:PrgI family protein [Candidatus Doudnabacteria bacterium]